MSVNGDTQQSLEKDKEHFQTMRIPEVKVKQIYINCLYIIANAIIAKTNLCFCIF